MRDASMLALAVAGLLLALAINVLVLPTNNLVPMLYVVPVLLATIRLHPRAVTAVSLLAILTYLVGPWS